MGITGAMMNVPILRFFGYSITKAIGSAAAIGLVISISGTLGFFSTGLYLDCLLYTSPSPRDRPLSRMPSSA